MGVGHITNIVATEIRVATSERCHPTVATAIGPACHQPNVGTDNCKFSPTSLFEMKTDDIKNSYCPKTTSVHIGRKDYTTLLKSIGVGIILSSTAGLFNYLPR
jgi:hypothetical protein